jgi:hypothetical protein
VILLFTVKKGSLPRGLEEVPGLLPVKFGIYLNILGIVFLAEPSERFSYASSQERPEAFGVDTIKALSEYEEPEEPAAASGDEPFL